jgi:hypothetical protein
MLKAKTTKKGKCPSCNKLGTLKRFGLTYLCNSECAFQLARKKKTIDKGSKIKKKEAASEFRQLKENTPKTRKAASKISCHTYIRARDVGKPCITCPKLLVEGDFDAGHFMESGNFSFTRYHEDNIHGQCKKCNRFKGGMLIEYEKNIRLKLGDEKVDWIHANKNKVTKRTIEDYRDIEKHYKDMLRQLQSN